MLVEQLAVEIGIQCSKNLTLSCIYGSSNGNSNKINDYIDMSYNCKKINNAISLCGDVKISGLNDGQHYLTYHRVHGGVF